MTSFGQKNEIYHIIYIFIYSCRFQLSKKKKKSYNSLFRKDECGRILQNLEVIETCEFKSKIILFVLDL